jgi:amidohydrolase
MKKKSINPLLFKEIDMVYPRMVSIRRAIHRNPELSGKEHQTARLVFDHLKNLGLKPVLCAGKTGVACTIRNGRGKTVVLRADLDALPVDEQNNVPFRSKNAGVMHACGHDMHTAILCGAAEVLMRFSKQWPGTITLLFQPSEEVEPGGALTLIREGRFPKKADAVLGLHVSTDYPAGVIGIKAGHDFAGLSIFEVIVHGRGGHSSTPEVTIDPIVCAAAMILELQTLVSRECSSLESAVFSVGSIHAGTQNNIIPDDARFVGTLRTLSDGLREKLSRRMREIIESTARAFRARAEVKISKSYPAGYNDPGLSARAMKTLSTVFGAKRILAREAPDMGAEDFAYYQRLAPGLFVHLGVRNAAQKDPAGMHSARFLPDEKALKTGVAFHVSVAMDLLNAGRG